MRIVDGENGDSCATGLCPTDQRCPEPLEVAFPRLKARVEEADNTRGKRIDSAQVRSLMKVASVTAPGAVLGCIGSAMLPGNDVFDVEIVDVLMIVSLSPVKSGQSKRRKAG